MKSLYERLKSYSESDFYGFHMPGHKRNVRLMENDLPYHLDITEIDGFDDLHHAGGILLEAQNRAAEVFHAEETHFLINGSTVGILSAVMGCVSRGGKILVSRNCHKSVYHAIEIQELEPVYVYPEFDARQGIYTQICPEDIDRALAQYPDIQAVMIVSPTYDGAVSDVSAIADVVHRYGIPLIVDEAHGSHFGFHPYFPENSNTLGVDIVIHSLHKTLPAPTQTALLHMNGTLAKRDKVRAYLHMLQSSSPSYILLAGMDECIRLIQGRGEELFSGYVKRLETTRNKLKTLKNLRLLETENFDKSKILISVKSCNIKAKEIYKLLLSKYHLQIEMVAGTYVLGMTSVGDTDEGMERLVGALCEIDRKLCADSQAQEQGRIFPLEALKPAEVVYTCAQMRKMTDPGHVRTGAGNPAPGEVKRLPWKACKGYISTEYAYLYPPGIPILVPGERVTEQIADLLLEYQRRDFTIEGVKEEGFLEVWIHG